MRPPLALLALLFSSAARAGTTAPVVPPEPKLVEEPSFYYHNTTHNSWWGDVVSRRDIHLVNDIGDLNDLCYIPPAADWVTEGASPDIERKYLNLIWRGAYSLARAQGRGNNGRTIGTCGVYADGQMANLGEFSNFYLGTFDDSIKKRTGFSSCRGARDFVKSHPKYASQGNRASSPGVAVVETLNLLIMSKTPETALNALADVRILYQSEKFRGSIEALARDKSVTATVTIRPDGVKETLPLRVFAMRTLATLERTERSAKLLALIWHDEKEPVEIREGAIRAFAFIVQWPGYVLNSDTDRPKMFKALYPFLAPLMMLNAEENDKKEEAGAAAKLSPLGEAAWCAAERFPKALRDKARKGKKYDDPD